MVERKGLKLGGVIFFIGGVILLLSQLLAKPKSNQGSKPQSDTLHSNLEAEYMELEDPAVFAYYL